MTKLLFFLFIISTAQATTLRVVTSNFPPFQVKSGDKVTGITTDIVEAVVKNAGYETEIKIYPWARAYKMSLKESKILVYSIVKTPDRDKYFKWIGVIAPYNVYFWKLKNRRDIKIVNTEDAKKYNCGGTFDDNKSIQLEKLGFVVGKNLSLVSTDALNIKKMLAGRIDLMTYDEVSFKNIVEAQGYDISLFQKIIKLEGSSHELQLAASVDMPDDVVEKLRDSLNDFKLTSKYQQILGRLK